jgi:pyruvate kinase
MGSDRIPFEGYPALGAELAPEDPVLLDDGALRLSVLQASSDEIRCRVVTGGPLSSGKGINLPESQLEGLEGLTEKDEIDLEFGLRHGVDFVALSFVRGGAEIERLRGLIREHGATTPIIAKIERRAALRNLDEIVTASDGVMVARGDLGVETELAEVALRQKEIIRACNQRGKVVITATQMLESMITHPTPTRAEVSDTSNAILDGSDALMLSGETAVGKYPVEAIRMIDSIALRTEEVIDSERGLARRPFLDEIPDAVAHAAVLLAHEVGAAAIICCTRGGMTARLVSRYRPNQPVFAASPNDEVVRRMAIVWGVRALSMDDRPGDELLHRAALACCRRAGLVRAGERVVVTSGAVEGGLKGQTDRVRVEIA